MKKKLIVYDFDKTIYGGETGTDFFKFYAKKKFVHAFVFSVKYLFTIALYLLKFISLKELKEKFFVFLERYTIDEVNQIVSEFWLFNQNKIYNWVESELVKNKKECDIVVVTSASPLFLVENFLLSKGYDIVFGTEFLKSDNGYFISKIDGKNNKGLEKVNKLNNWSKKNKIDYEIVKFYSDSIADKPLYDLSDEKIWIKNGEKVIGMPPKKTLIDKLFWK